MDRPFGRGANRIEADERSGRHENPRAFLARALDQVAVFQQLRNRKRHEDAAFVDGAERDVAEQGGRQAFDDDVTVVCEFGGLADGNVTADLRQCPSRLFRVAHGYGCKGETRDARDQAFCHLEPDRAETGEADTQRLLVIRLCHFFRPVKLGLRFSMKARTPSA